MRTSRILTPFVVLTLATLGTFCGGDEATNQPPPADGGPQADSGGGDGGTTARPWEAVPVASRPNITGLTGPVDVVRDKYGMVHIYATNQDDAFRVQGYQVARDRTAQLELLRRSATGRLAELLGSFSPSLVDQDIVMRTIGLARPAKEMLAATTPEIRASIDAYIDGISQFNARVRSGEEKLPAGMILLDPNAFQPWTPEDVIAVARLQALNLSYSADSEMALSSFVESVRGVMNGSSADPKLVARAGFLNDVVRFAPLDATTVLGGYPTAATPKTLELVHQNPNAPVSTFRASRELLEASRTFQTALNATRDLAGGNHAGMTGSNNWIVGPKLSKTGHAMLANDPHLQLSAPAVFWNVHIKVDAQNPTDSLDFAGTAFPGLPAVILGFNENIAWGATTAFFDVTDVYQETLTPDGTGVVFKGAPVPFQKVTEKIEINGGSPLNYDVLVVPHHGPIVPTITPDHKVAPPTGKALSVKWTGHKPTNDLASVFGMLRAKNVDDAYQALSSFAVGAQNWVVVDTSDNILYYAHALVPKRDKKAFAWDPATFSGTLPGFVLPGDGSAEWTDQFLEQAYLPQAKNPAKGFIVTANNDQVGTLLDNDPSNDKLPNGEPFYLSSFYTEGFRAGRITQRIETAKSPLSVDDLADIQADARSPIGARVTTELLKAIDAGLEEQATPGTHADLAALVASDRWKNAPVAEIKDLLTRWGTDSDYYAASGINADDNKPSADPKENAASRATTIFNVWFGQMVTLTLGDELDKVGGSRGLETDRALIYLLTSDKTKLKTFDATLQDSILFDDLNTAPVETRSERAVHALLDTVDYLKTRLGADTTQWQWGRIHTLRFDALVQLWGSLSIPPVGDAVFPNGFPRHGDAYSVDVATFGFPTKLDSSASYAYRFGPSQRFVTGMDPSAPVRKNVLPGGNVWDPASPHFRDEAERWRRNQNRPIPFTTAEVVDSAEQRVVYESK